MFCAILKRSRQMIASVAEMKQYLWCLQRSGHTTHSERCSQKANITRTEPRKDHSDHVRKSSSHNTIDAMISFANYPVEIQHDMALIDQCDSAPLASRQS